MSPTITQPETPEIYTFLYNDTAGVSCTFTAVPDLDSTSVQWKLGETEVGSGDPYTLVWEEATDTFPFGVSSGWRSDLSFNTQDIQVTCQGVLVFDGIYACVVDDGTQDSTSNQITASVLCKYQIIF